MTSTAPGATAILTAQWFQFTGGPAVDVTGQTITITRLADSTVVVGPTGTGILHPATGLYTYPWAVPLDTAAGDYAVVWDATDADSEAVQTSEILTVVAFTSDPTTPLGKIRLLIPDVDPAAVLFTDAQINAFYLMEASNVRLAAAQALDTAASNEAMVSKVIRTLDLQTDGSKVSAELRARAAALRAQAGDYDNDGNPFAMDIVDFRPDRWWFLGDHEQEEPRWCP